MREVEKKVTKKVVEFMLEPDKANSYINSNTEVICAKNPYMYMHELEVCLHGNRIFRATGDKTLGWLLYVNCRAACTDGIISRTTASRLNALMHVFKTGCCFGQQAGQTEMRFDSGESVVNGEHGFSDVEWINVGSLDTTELEEIYSKIKC